jgi:putative FmdB family regulatory protein
MPIYAYRCERCGHSQDVMQKFSDAPLTTCTACGAEAFAKQLTAPAFQLKGSGWYVTDFRDNGKSKSTAKSDEAKADDAKPADAKAGGAASDGAKVAAEPASGAEPSKAGPTPTPTTAAAD